MGEKAAGYGCSAQRISTAVRSPEAAPLDHWIAGAPSHRIAGTPERRTAGPRGRRLPATRIAGHWIASHWVASHWVASRWIASRWIMQREPCSSVPAAQASSPAELVDDASRFQDSHLARR